MTKQVSKAVQKTAERYAKRLRGGGIDHANR